ALASSDKHKTFLIYYSPKNYLDGSKSTGGKKFYINGKEIYFIVSDGWVFAPHLFVYRNQEIIFGSGAT
ncbi:MAG TPA: hypothetical protein VK325_11380, partial [Pseudoxanthomonas sp.]|nr:hypothetical protein [Pseudoxanthomonas sp.]